MREMNARGVIITMMDGTLIQGMTNIGNSRRLSDFLRKDDGNFITIFNATMGESTQRDVYFVNKTHILWAKPDEKDYASEFDDNTVPTSEDHPIFK
jgi:hypothetical protein